MVFFHTSKNVSNMGPGHTSHFDPGLAVPLWLPFGGGGALQNAHKYTSAQKRKRVPNIACTVLQGIRDSWVALGD